MIRDINNLNNDDLLVIRSEKQTAEKQFGVVSEIHERREEEVRKSGY